jgi:phospholipid/cholesterol/gamma-HCH transport system permease protein
MAEGWIEAAGEGDGLVLRAGGEWLVGRAAALATKLSALKVPPAGPVRIDLSAIEALDTTGAWLVVRLRRTLAARGRVVAVENVARELAPLLRQVEKGATEEPHPPRRHPETLADGLAFVGAATMEFFHTATAHLGFLGHVVIVLGRTALHPARLRLVSVVAHMQRAGVSALPIVGLLSFLVGIVTAYQSADQLRPYGATIFAVNLLGLGFLREMGVLLAAIIVAGRSGSAFTAEIGAMVVNQEVDALRTLSIDPIEVLVLPRIFALVLTLPLLAFYANVMGIVGGAILCWLVLGIPLPAFMQQLQGAVSLWTFWLGIIKAPFFAGAIALVGCHEGLNVAPSAESVGRHTMRAVVQSIFLVIIIDAAFSVLFSWLGI